MNNSQAIKLYFMYKGISEICWRVWRGMPLHWTWRTCLESDRASIQCIVTSVGDTDNTKVIVSDAIMID